MRVSGWLLLMESFFMAFPLLCSIFFHESDIISFALSASITLAAGLMLTYLPRPNNTHLGKRDGFLLTASVWVIFSLFGMLPFLLREHPLTVSNAFFEAMSGFTTTGASTISSAASLTHGMHLWRALMQWLGGMGIILFTVALLPMLNTTGGMQMINAELTGITHDKIRPRVSQTAKSLWGIYILLTVVLLTLLLFAGVNWFDALCHSMGTVSTGGYTTYDSSSSFLTTPFLKIIVTVFMFLGGVNFTLLYRLLTGHLRMVWRNEVLRLYVSIIIAGSALVVASAWFHRRNINMTGTVVDALFQVVSTSSSTGYVLSGERVWGGEVALLMMVMTFFGACAGSTSGGVKLDRLVVLIKHCYYELVRCVHPNNIYPVRLNGRVMPTQQVSKVVVFIFFFIGIIAGGTAVFGIMGVDMGNAFHLALNCMANAGVGNSYAGTPDVVKWFMAFLMLVGRLELFTVLVLFTRTFWHK